MRAITIVPPPRSGFIPLFCFVLFCLFASASSSRAQGVSLTWQADPAGTAAGYYLYLGTNSGDYTTKLDVGTNTVATITGLTPGLTYYFVVTAYDTARIESPPSAEVSFTAPAAPSASGPQLAAVSPASAPPGAQVYLYGTNLSTATSVSFAGVKAVFASPSNGLLVATVPATAASGPLTVTTSQGTVTTLFVVVPVPAPANDNFNNAQILSGNIVFASTNTVGATKQSGEPNHAGNPGGSSVWYRWVAPSAGTWMLDSTGSSFATLLAVYTGNNLSSLSPVASNLVAAGVYTNVLAINVSSGVTYQIAIDGLNGACGNLALRLVPAATSAVLCSATFEPAAGFLSSLPLVGQQGWLSQGSAYSGLSAGVFPGYGTQAYLGLGSPSPATTSSLYVPLNYTVNTNTSPLVQFSALMQIFNIFGAYADRFAWVVRNSAGHELFRISFDDANLGISYALDNGAGAVSAGGFSDGTIYNIAVSMDFSHNLWSATLNGTALVTAKPITTTGAALTLGDIDANEIFNSPSQPGSDGMLFDNYLVTAGPGLAPMILQAPLAQNSAAGNSVFLAAAAAGAPPLSYQWSFNNSPIANATNAGLLLTNLSTAQTGSYSLLVANAYGSASSGATLTVTNIPPKALFAAPVSKSSTGALLSLAVTPGYNYSFQASTNLRTWVTLGSFLAASTNAICFDAAATNSPCRFYRLVSP